MPYIGHVNDVRVVRVNDIELARVNGVFYVANVDTGPGGLLRRLGLPVPFSRRARKGSGASQGIISWDVVEPSGTHAPRCDSFRAR